MKSINLNTLNQTMQNPEERQKADAALLSDIHAVAKSIQSQRKERPIVLLAGPSGSGKTTTAHMICDWLCENGTNAVPISLDDFFRTMGPEERQLMARNKLDLESPERLNFEILNHTLSELYKGNPVRMPRYDFPTMTMVETDTVLQPKEDTVFVLEGIHALNPNVITLPEESASRVYVSVRTRVAYVDLVLHPSRIRLERRMVRDKNFRKRTLQDTLTMFEKVQEGEHKYIQPYKQLAPYHIDTFLPYETGVYRSLLHPELVPCFRHSLLRELGEMWDYIQPIEASSIASTSMMHEFIG